MKKQICTLLAILMMLATAAICQAEDMDWHGSIRSRVDMEYQRIERGIEQGLLTRHEAHRLKGELDGILERIDRMRRDGRLDHREREIIHRDLDRLHRDISREKRDDEQRPSYDDRRPPFHDRGQY